MSTLGTVSRKASEQNLPSILIGGHAVMAHGFARTTWDVDLLIPKTSSVGWRKLLEELNYTVLFSGPSFLQFNPPPGAIAPVDLMLVNDETFMRMHADAGGCQADDLG